MQFRQMAAVAGSALMAGLSIAAPALSATVTDLSKIGGLVTVSDSTTTFPIFVTGAAAKPEDVNSALNLAVRLAAQSSTGGSGTTSTTTGFVGISEHMELERNAGGQDTIENQQKGLGFGTASTSFRALVPTGETGGREVGFLKRGTITVSDVEYKWKEIVNLTNSTDLDASWDQTASLSQDNYRNMVVTLQAASRTTTPSTSISSGLSYGVTFDKNITPANLKGKTISWLGKNYVVTSVKLDVSPAEVQLAPSATLKTVSPGDEIKVGTHTVTVTSIAETNVGVTVADSAGVSESKTINEGDTDTVNGVQVFIKSSVEAYTAGNIKTGSAELLMTEGTLVMKITDGQRYPKGATTGDWFGWVNSSTTALRQFGIYYNRARTSSQAIKDGEKISAPDDFFALQYNGYGGIGSAGSTTINFETANYIDTNEDGTTDTYAIRISTADGTKIFSVSGDVSGAASVSEVFLQTRSAASTTASAVTDISGERWIIINTSSGYERLSAAPSVIYSDNPWPASGAALNFVTSPEVVGLGYGGELYGVGAGTDAGNFTIDEANGFIVLVEPDAQSAMTGAFIIEYQNQSALSLSVSRRFNTTRKYPWNGATGSISPGGESDDDTLSYASWNTTDTQTQATARDQIWLARSGSSSYSRAGFRSPYGGKLVSASENMVSIEIPKSRSGPVFSLGQPSGTITTTTGGGTIIPITSDIVALDSDYAAKTDVTTDVVVVGGPCINKLAAWLLNADYPSCGAASGVPQNKALVRLVTDAFVDGKTALLVAGWEASDTDFAARVLQNYDKVTGLAGLDEATLSGTSVTSPTIE